MKQDLLYQQVIVLTGSFGSGKSEYAISLALEKGHNLPTAVVDLDLVNAYFRIREARQLLQSHGVKAVVPDQDVFHSDLPIPGPGIKDLIADGDYRVILDVGGDNLGATGLRSYLPQIQTSEHTVAMVVNPYRPFTRDLSSIIAMKEEIETASGLTVTALVSNPNIGSATTMEFILGKHGLVQEAADVLGLPLLELLVWDQLIPQAEALRTAISTPIRWMHIHLLPGWLLKQHQEGV